jgi:hypothetical protein
MRRRLLLAALGLAFIASGVTSFEILDDVPTPPGTTFEFDEGRAPYCDKVGEIVLVGQGAHYGDIRLPDGVVARCEEAARLPGSIGIALGLAGLPAGIGCGIIYWRGRPVTSRGEPISVLGRPPV